MYFLGANRGNAPLRRFFAFVWRLILSILKWLIILGIVIIALLLYFTEKEESQGQGWCDEMIAEYESDKSTFLEVHKQNTKNGMEYFPPKSKSKKVHGYFTLQANGEYSCRYWHGGASKPHSYSYSSKTKKWDIPD